MTTLSQSPFNDLSIDENGILRLSHGIESYSDIIASAIKTIRGEMQFDTNSGIPYFQTIFDKFGGLAQWENAVRNEINRFDFVVDIKKFDVSVVGKLLSYKIVILTNTGEITVSA